MGQLGDLSPAGSVAVGIVVGLLSTSIQSIGLTLQRKSHLLEDEKEDELIRRPPYRRRRWQLGMSLFVISNLVGSTIQITTLPLPVLSTLQASGLVFNTICATLLLGEPFTRWSLCGTILVAGGALLIAMFGALPEPSHNLTQLMFLLGRDQFIVWMVFTVLMILSVLLLAWILSRLATANKPRIRLGIGMCFGSVSSILSAHSLLMAKSAVELVVRTIVDHVNQFNQWQSWIILLVLLFLALSQLYFLHRGLKLCSTSVLYPFVFCIYNIIAILDGLIYFRQTDRLPPLHAGLIALGTVILLSGVLALSWRLGYDDSVGSPPDAHTLLTPGMGIVEDTTTEDEADDGIYGSPYPLNSDDEEAATHRSERASLLRNRHSLTPKSKDNTILSHNRKTRQDLVTPMEALDIWNELCDTAKSSPRYRFNAGEGTGRRASTVTYAAKKPFSAIESDEDADIHTDANTEEEHISPFTVLKKKAPSGRHKRSRTIHAGVSLSKSTFDGIDEAGRRTSSQALSKDTGRSHPLTSSGNISPFYARHLYNQERRNRWSLRHRSKSSPLAQRYSISSSQLQKQPNSPTRTGQGQDSKSSGNYNTHAVRMVREELYDSPDEDENLGDDYENTISTIEVGQGDGQGDITASYGAISTTSTPSSYNRHRQYRSRRGTNTATGTRRGRNSSLTGLLLDWWRRPKRDSSNNIQ